MIAIRSSEGTFLHPLSTKMLLLALTLVVGLASVAGQSSSGGRPSVKLTTLPQRAPRRASATRGPPSSEAEPSRCSERVALK